MNFHGRSPPCAMEYILNASMTPLKSTLAKLRLVERQKKPRQRIAMTSHRETVIDTNGLMEAGRTSSSYFVTLGPATRSPFPLPFVFLWHAKHHLAGHNCHKTAR